MEIPNSIATPADSTANDACLEEYKRGSRSVLWLTVREGRKFILKGLPEPLRLHPEEIVRLRKEYSLGLRINHPCVAGVYGFETIPTLGPVIVMEYVDGITLAEFLHKPDLRPLKERIAIARQIADALAYIHSLGISHRDLKPDNILITRRGDAKIIDIGLGDSEDSVVYKQSLATEKFGAPEQQTPSVADSRADVYSFGKILKLLLPESKFRKLKARCLDDAPDARPSMKDVVGMLDFASKQKTRSVWRWISIGLSAIVAIGLLFAIATGIYNDFSRTPAPAEVEPETKSETSGSEISKSEMPDALPAEDFSHKSPVESENKKNIELIPSKSAPAETSTPSTDYEAIFNNYLDEMNAAVVALGCGYDKEKRVYIQSVATARGNALADIASRMVEEFTLTGCPYDEMNRLSNLFYDSSVKAIEKIDGKKLE